jgi:leucyl aminopeptidase
MQIIIESKPLEQIEAGALIVLVFEGRKERSASAPANLFDAGEITGKVLEFTLLHRPPGVAATRVLLAGAGKPEKFDSAELRKVAGRGGAAPEGQIGEAIALALDPGTRGRGLCRRRRRGRDPGRVRTGPLQDGRGRQEGHGFVRGGGAGGADLDEAARARADSGEAQNFTRGLVNEPANRLTPAKMVEAARQMASEYQLECEVLEREQMEKLGMGALLGVAQGSAEPPALIVIRYRPAQPEAGASGPGGQGRHLRYRAASPSSPPTAWRR